MLKMLSVFGLLFLGSMPNMARAEIVVDRTPLDEIRPGSTMEFGRQTKVIVGVLNPYTSYEFWGSGRAECFLKARAMAEPSIQFMPGDKIKIRQLSYVDEEVCQDGFFQQDCYMKRGLRIQFESELIDQMTCYKECKAIAGDYAPEHLTVRLLRAALNWRVWFNKP